MRSLIAVMKVAPVVVVTLFATGTGNGKAGAPVSGQVSIVERPGDQTEDLNNTVIYLEPSGSAKVKVSPTNESMSVQSRNFAPHVAVVPAGSKIEFVNRDPFSHNVFSKASQGPFDTDVFGRGKKKSATVKQAGIYPLYCNVHPRMTGYVIALNTPYYAQAGQDGRFSIGNVPAGNYVLHVWHERGGEQTANVSVPDAGLGGLRYQLDARNYKYVQHKDKNGKDYNFKGDIY
jgi:plastocyanin